MIFFKNNLLNTSNIEKIIKKYKVNVIIHLAAQAGVRHSLTNPLDYVKNNLEATTCLLEACKKKKIKHFYFPAQVVYMDLLKGKNLREFKYRLSYSILCSN